MIKRETTLLHDLKAMCARLEMEISDHDNTAKLLGQRLEELRGKIDEGRGSPEDHNSYDTCLQKLNELSCCRDKDQRNYNLCHSQIFALEASLSVLGRGNYNYQQLIHNQETSLAALSDGGGDNLLNDGFGDMHI